MVLGPECLPSILLLAVPSWPCSTPFYEFNFKWPADLSLPRPSSLPLEPTSPSRGITIRSYDPTAIIRQTPRIHINLGRLPAPISLIPFVVPSRCSSSLLYGAQQLQLFQELISLRHNVPCQHTPRERTCTSHRTISHCTNSKHMICRGKQPGSEVYEKDAMMQLLPKELRWWAHLCGTNPR